jgi:hypothetical protein
LVKAGLPAVLEPLQNGDARVRLGADLDKSMISWLVYRVPGGESGAEGDDIPREAQEAFLGWEDTNAYGLIVDGQDRTDTLRSCHEQSGYWAPQLASDLREEAQFKQQLADSTNDWVSCARDNGYPGLKDVTATADGWKTYPAVYLPLSMSVNALDTLLVACPKFDAEQNRKLLDASGDFDIEEWTPDPQVLIEEPGSLTGPDGQATADARHYEELRRVLTRDATQALESE